MKTIKKKILNSYSCLENAKNSKSLQPFSFKQQYKNQINFVKNYYFFFKFSFCYFMIKMYLLFFLMISKI